MPVVISEPIVHDQLGRLIVCRLCYPMFATPDVPFHRGHYRGGDPGRAKISVYEPWVSGVGSDQLEHVAEVVQTEGVPGLLLFEYVFDGDQIRVCRRSGHAEPVVRIRYSPDAYIVRRDS